MATANVMTSTALSNGFTVNVMIEGTAPILQHAFTENHLATLAERAKKNTGAPDYALEWIGTMYVSRVDGQDYICQPASHVESAMLKAAVNFKIAGKRGKTWKDAVQAYLYVSPDNILHIRNGEYVPAPDGTLINNPVNGLSVSVMRVKVQRAAVARSRLMIDAGWQLAFTMNIIDDQLRPDVVSTILQEAGRAVGIGDYRPRYGRFNVVSFEVV
jgi:hypothetical protein